MAARYTLRTLKDRCRLIEAHVRARSLATAVELDAYRPGGEENPEKHGLGPWVFWYGNLCRFNARADNAVAAPVLAESNAVAVLAMADMPVPIALRQDPGWTDKPSTAFVHPKSLHALLHLRAYEDALEHLAFYVNKLSVSREAEAMKLVSRTLEAMSWEYAVMAWILTTPGPGLPFEPNEGMPEPPATFRKWLPEDFIEVARANLVVNGARLKQTRQLCRAVQEGEPHRPVFSVLLASLGLEAGMDWRLLTKDRTLVGLLSGLTLGQDERMAQQQDKQREEEMLRASKGEDADEPVTAR